MKMYLNSQYHMEPPDWATPDGAWEQLYRHSSIVTGMC
jgi:hypothetical protein